MNEFPHDWLAQLTPDKQGVAALAFLAMDQALQALRVRVAAGEVDYTQFLEIVSGILGIFLRSLDAAGIPLPGTAEGFALAIPLPETPSPHLVHITASSEEEAIEKLLQGLQ